MWVAFFAFALAVAAMIFLSPKVSVENAKPAKFGDLQIPRSNYGDPISLLFGTERQKSPVVLWYGDFSTVAITETIDGGLFHSDKSYVTGHKYYLGFDLALCLGPGVVLKRIFSDTDIIWEGSKSADGDITIDQENLFGGDKSGGGLKGTATFYTGSFDTARDSYLATKVDENIPSYNGICRIVFKNFYIGTAATLPSISFEISRLTSGLDSTYSIMPNGVDLNPIEIAYDALTRNFGCFGNSPDLLDLPSFISSAQILYDENIQMSILIQSSITGEDLINEVMTQCDGLMYQDPATSKIVCKLIREDYDIEDLITLDESSIKSLTNFAKSTWNDTFNQVRVTFSNRDDDYDDSVAVAQDFANINFQDRVKSTEISAVGCKTSSTALIMASKQLSFVSVPLYKCDIICNRRAQSLRPGDCFILNWSPFSLTNMVMRISKISLGELTNNEITITCIQDKFSTSTPIFAQPDVSHFVPINSEPAPVVYTSIFTPPLFLSSNSSTETLSSFDNFGRLYSVAKKPTGASFLYDVMLSSDNFVSNLVLGNESVIYNSTGKLLNDYPNTVAFSTKHDTSGDLIIYDMSNEDISNLKQFTTLDQARRGQALILIGSELFIYVGYSNNGDGSVTFNNVYRSIYDTTSYSHLANARVWFIEGINGLINTLIPNSELKYIKLLDTTYSNKLTLDEATLITATQTGRAGLPLPTNYLTINGSRNPSPITGSSSVTVGWRNRDRNNLSLQVYDEIGSSREPGTQTRIRWRVGAGEYATITTTSSTVNLDISGLTGILEVIADQQIISNSKYSAVSESLTVTVESYMTSFLCNFNGTDGSTTFIDESGKTITPVGNACISTAQSKFGGASGYFDGNGDYLTLPNSEDFNFGTGDFTLEAWVYPTSLVGYQCIFGGGLGEYIFSLVDTSLELGSWFQYKVAGSSVGDVSINMWQHICFTRSAGIVRLFIGGVQKGIGEDLVSRSYASDPRIGQNSYNGGFSDANFHGYIDDLRITKGLARHTSDFTPPTSQLTL